MCTKVMNWVDTPPTENFHDWAFFLDGLFKWTKEKRISNLRLLLILAPYFRNFPPLFVPKFFNSTPFSVNWKWDIVIKKICPKNYVFHAYIYVGSKGSKEEKLNVNSETPFNNNSGRTGFKKIGMFFGKILKLISILHLFNQ